MHDDGIVRVDRASGQLRRYPVDAPVSSFAIGDEALWVVRSAPVIDPQQGDAGSSELLRIDPDTGEITGRLDLTGSNGGGPGAFTNFSGDPIALAAAVVWVAVIDDPSRFSWTLLGIRAGPDDLAVETEIPIGMTYFGIPPRLEADAEDAVLVTGQLGGRGPLYVVQADGLVSDLAVGEPGTLGPGRDSTGRVV